MSIVEISRDKKLRLTKEEKRLARISILFYSSFASKGIHSIPEFLESAYVKLEGKDFEKKKKEMESMLVIQDSMDLENWMLEQIQKIEEV